MDDFAVSKQKAVETWLRHWAAGPARLRWSSLPVQTGDPAPDVLLKTGAGADFALSRAWRDGPAVVVFLRHFGCGCAWERAARLAAELPKLRAAGANVVAVGQGDPLRAARFREQAGLDCPVLSDEGRLAYEAYGLLEARPAQVVYGMGDAFLMRDVKAAEDLVASRLHSERTPVDSPWQLPGEFVIGQDGVIALAYRSQFCADYADPDVLASSVRETQLGKKGAGLS